MISTPSSFQNAKADILRAALLAIFVAIIWCTLMDRWSVSAWTTPLEYIDNPERNDDVLFYFAEVKSAMTGHYLPLHEKVFPQLGAPNKATWGDYPTTEQFIIWVTSWFARGIGLFAACNFMVLFAQVLAAVSLFATCRALGCKWEWSFSLGLVYGLAPYAFSRGEHHLDLTFYWHIPLCLLVTRWLTVGDGINFRERKFLFAVVLAFITGLQNQYYTFMFVQLVLLGAIVQWFRRGWRALIPHLVICAVSGGGFLLLILDNLVFRAQHGTNAEGLVRTFGLVEMYALKPIDLFVPFSGHRIFSGVADRYSQIVFIRGELPMSGYLGLIGIIGLLWLGIDTLVKQVRRTAPIALEAGQTLWIFLVATVGGVTALLALSGIYFFRASGRYSIFLLALSLIFLARRLSTFAQNKRTLRRIGAVGIIFIAIVDQTPAIMTKQQLTETASAVESDRRFTPTIESRLPDQAMVFQLPDLDFPEAAPATRYHHLRPFLFSDRLRFSFGNVKGRNVPEWKAALASMPVDQGIQLLKQNGFGAIYVDRSQYNDAGSSVFESFSKTGLPIIESERHDLFCALLNN